MNIISKIKGMLDDYFSADERLQITKLLKKNDEISQLVGDKEAKISFLKVLNDKVLADKDKLQKQLVKLQIKNTSDLDKYCSLHFKKMSMPAYKQKRKIKNKDVTIALNELITPNSYEVIEFFKRIDKSNIQSIGNKTARKLTWTSDFNLSTSGDYYLYPNESIALKKGDCEDVSFVNASANPELLGIAWGFYDNGKKRFGHAFNIFVKKGKLFILETTGSQGVIHLWKGNERDDYKIYFIVTSKQAYRVKSGVTFGALAGW